MPVTAECVLAELGQGTIPSMAAGCCGKALLAYEIIDMKVMFGARNGTHFSIDIKEEIILVSADTVQAHFQ